MGRAMTKHSIVTASSILGCNQGHFIRHFNRVYGIAGFFFRISRSYALGAFYN